VCRIGTPGNCNRTVRLWYSGRHTQIILLSVGIAIYDVFARHPFGGNQAAVVRDERCRLSDADLLALASELSFPETTLSRHEGTDLILRFATADRLVNRCGHATLAAVADHVLVQQSQDQGRCCKWHGNYRVGVARAEWRARIKNPHKDASPSVEVGVIWPERPTAAGSLPGLAVYRALGLSSADPPGDLPLCVYDSGNRNALVPVRSVASLERVSPNQQKLRSLFEEHRLTDAHIYCIDHVDKTGGRIRIRCRNVFPYGVFEETATGSAAVALSAFLIDHLPVLGNGNRAVDFLFQQGIGKRRGNIGVQWRLAPGQNQIIWLKGRVFPILTGNLVYISENSSRRLERGGFHAHDQNV